MKVKSKFVLKVLSAAILATVLSPAVQASTAISIEKEISTLELLQAPSEITFYLYDAIDAVNPVSSQTFDAKLWLSADDYIAGNTKRVSTQFTNTESLDTAGQLWVETIVDGVQLGERHELRAPPPIDISVHNYIEARDGGFIFPDGSIQDEAGIIVESDPGLPGHTANANAHHRPPTDAEILTAIKNVDGPKSGLDADLLDGQQGSAFATSAHNHNATYVNVSGDTMMGSLTVKGPILPLSEAAQFYGDVNLYETDGTKTIDLDADSGQITLNNGDGSRQIEIAGDAGTGGYMRFYNEADVQTLYFDGDSSGGSYMQLEDSAGKKTIVLDGQELTSGGGEINLYNVDIKRTVQIDGDSSNSGGYIQLYDSAGNVTITLDGHADGDGDGRITTEELAITGGSDLSEQFDIAQITRSIEPGMLVSIDPNNPGKLILSVDAYDSKVAGIISGAGGIKTGMMMGQEGSIANGEYPVALTGRVYALVDASANSIIPGDLLTTSDIPGHAMKVTDQSKAMGAVIGKAMTPLKEGKGLVLVLVSLQ